MRFVRLVILIIAMASAVDVRAQSTEFTYQGRLLFGDVAATGSHDFEFVLWDAASGGSQLGPTVSLGAVNVNNGVFSVRVDFGNQFPGANRFLEIRVRQAGTGLPFNSLAPRQAISSAPYAIKSLNAENASSAHTAANANQLGGLPAGQFVITNDPRLTDPRSPLPNSPNYVQNSTSPQTSSNFNISGTGKAGAFDATVEYRIGGNSVLGLKPGTQNFFAGNFAGASITSGNFNSFFGMGAGRNTATGGSNSFFGNLAGNGNTSGGFNSFFGDGAGLANTTGLSNTFVGALAGIANSTAGGNSFFGEQSGRENTVGTFNTFVGRLAGNATTTGGGNSFFGVQAGQANVGGSNNTAIGNFANLGSGGLINATAIGSAAFVSQNNSLVLGSIAGVNGANADTRVGIGTTAPVAKLHVSAATTGPDSPVAILQSSGTQIPLAFKIGSVELARVRADSFGNLVLATVAGSFKDIYFRAGDDAETDLFVNASNGRVGVATIVPQAKLHVNGNGIINSDLSIGSPSPAAATLGVAGTSRFVTLGSGGSLQLCRNSSLLIGTCSSSARYKSNIADLDIGLDLINRLRPVSYNWKADNVEDIGLVAEEVAAIEPRLITRNENGDVEGVKYDRLTVVLINVVKEQQLEIARLREKDRQHDELIHEFRKQQEMMDALKVLICGYSSAADVCKEEKR